MADVYSPLKAAWHIDRIAALRERRDIVPTHIHLVIADLCNQDCHFCSYRMSSGFASQNFADADGNRNPKRFIPTAKALELLDDCAAVGVKAIEFTGGGEPTVHPDHRAIIAHAQALGLETGLVTNGVRLVEDACFSNLTWLRISLDAGTGETYEAIRSSKAWPKVLDHMAMAGKWQGPFTGAGFVVTKENWREIGEAARIVKAAGLRYLRISAMFSTEEARHYEGLLPSIRSSIEDARALEDADFKVIDRFGDRIADLDQGRPEYAFCAEQQFVLYIGGDQKIYTCCTNAYTDHGEIGDLKTARFREWLRGHRRFDFDARSCHHCQFNQMNRTVNFLIEPTPAHVNFV